MTTGARRGFRSPTPACSLITVFEPLLVKALETPTDIAYRLDARWATFQGQHERALTQAQRAVDLAPYQDGALIEVAMALIWAGRPEEGLRRADEARRLSPKSIGNEAVRGIRHNQIIDFRTSSIADGSLHDPSHGQDQSPDEIFVRDNPATTSASTLSAMSASKSNRPPAYVS